MTFVSYAQNFEDVVLWRALADVSSGRYLDIGAQDPDKDSVSKAFFEAGWRGVHVEASPHYANRLREARPDEQVIQALVGEGDEGAVFFEVPETGLSTGVLEIAEHHRAAGYEVREVRVPCITLAAILENFAGEAIHWMKIDVEGMEAEVLRSWGECPVRPWVLSIEATFPNSQIPVHHEWIDEVIQRGYHEVYFDGLSRYFVHEMHKGRADAFSAPPNVFDGYAITEDHFSAGWINHRSQLAYQAVEQTLAASEQQWSVERADLTGKIETNWRELEIARIRLIDANSEVAKQRADFLADAKAQQIRFDTLSSEIATAITKSELVAEEAARERAGHKAILATLANERDALSASHAAHLTSLHTQVVALEARRAEALAERDGLANANAEQTATLTSLQATHASLVERSAVIDAQKRHALERISLLSSRMEEIEQLNRQILGTRWWKLGDLIGLIKTPATSVPSRMPGLSLWENMPDHLEDTMSISGNFDPTQNGLEPNSLADLLALGDEQFVRGAYNAILGRKGDPAGVLHYTSAIRSGVSKLQILKSLRRSPEGRQHAAQIAGLDAAVRTYTIANLPLFGRILRPFFRTDAERPLERQVRQIAAQIARAGYEHRLVLREVHEIKVEIDGIRTALTSGQHARIEAGRDQQQMADMRDAPSNQRSPLARYFEQTAWGRP